MYKALIRFFFLVVLTSSVIACSIIPEHERSVLEYNCDELVVVGRVKTIDYTLDHPDNELEWLGPWYAKWNLEIRIKRVIYGEEARKVVPGFSISHAQMREDKDFVLVLTPSDDAYEIRTGNLVSLRPKPTPTANCTE